MNHRKNQPAGHLTDELLTTLLATLTLEQKVRLVTGASFWRLAAEPAIGLAAVVVSDGPAGVRGESTDGRHSSASLPSPTAMAATWDTDRLDRIGGLLASEARRQGVDVVLGPTVNIQRSPRGGRHFESFSEDPWLTGVVGAAYVRGVQSQGVGTATKHYVANDSETDRMSVDVRVDERTLREVYLAPFERIVREGGAWLVMSAYNSVNGTTNSANELLLSPLKDEWGFDGVVVSDWGGVRDTVAAGNAAQDLAMPGPGGVWGEALVDAVRDGRVPEAAVDAKVIRIIRLAARVGALRDVAPATPPAAEWDGPAVTAFLRESAADAMVLARNDGVLPLPRGGTPSIAVLGQHAMRGRNQGGGSASVFPDHVISPLEGIRAAFGTENVSYAAGVPAADPLLPLDLAVSTDPVSGEAGVHVQFRDAAGGVIVEEHHDGGRMGWLGADAVHGAASIALSARFTAPHAGTFALGFSGVGEFTFHVDGEVVADGPLFPENMDPSVAFLTPPRLSFPVTLEAGQAAELVLEHRPQLAGEMSVVMFTVGYEEPFGPRAEEMVRAIELAERSDVVVVVVGTTEHIESEGVDRAGLRLPDGHDELVERAIEANPRTIVVVNSGAPVLMPWYDKAPAVLLTWFPGQEFGDALADVLTGAREPGGRTPNTWPAAEADVPVWQVEPADGRLHYSEGVHIGYREWARRAQSGGPAPAVPFGHGLGYTTWDLTDLRTESTPEGLTAVVDIANTGPRAGKQVVQLYLSRTSPSSVDRPVLWLAGFATVTVEPGETRTCRIAVEPRSLQHWSPERHEWVTEPGEYELRVGRSVSDLPLGAAVHVG